MIYSEAIQFLYRLRFFGAKFGLKNTFKLAALAGNPQQRLRFIHVAGTNGKGSSCAMLESIYRTAGLRVGLFTSPHLVSFRERIQVNRQLISEADVVRLVAAVRPLLDGFPQDHHPTFFEVVTVVALRYFAEQKCDLVIWETGLGGRLDATNIVTPLASVITNIQYDHQKWLGETLARIAFEKAGIIKASVPVITGTDEPEALAVIEQTARSQGAPLTHVRATDSDLPPLSTVELPLIGQHQRFNAALAIAAVRVLAFRLPVEDDIIITGLSKVRWAGRLQLVTLPSGKRVLLDGAHNVGGAQTLAVALKEGFASAKSTLVLGILSDKDWDGMCQILAPLARHIRLVPVPTERTAAPQALAQACRRANPDAQVRTHATLADALAQLANTEFIIIAGSLYLVGEALELLHAADAGAADERALNDWSAKV